MLVLQLVFLFLFLSLVALVTSFATLLAIEILEDHFPRYYDKLTGRSK